MDIKKIKDTDDELLIREIVDRLPWGIVVIDHALNVRYMNPRVREIFDPPAAQLLPMDRKKAPACMGHILGCSHNGSGNASEGRGACRHCEFRTSIDMISDIASKVHTGSPAGEYTVVKEFVVHGKKVLKYLKIQYVVLGGDRLMVLVDDQTQAALAASAKA